MVDTADPVLRDELRKLERQFRRKDEGLPAGGKQGSDFVTRSEHGSPDLSSHHLFSRTAHGHASTDLSDTPQGELGGTWASPTVDGTHSGSAHHAAGGNTLDAAYDQGGAGSGSDITVSDGVVTLKHSSSVDMLQTEITGEANPGWKIDTDGKQSWGPGGATAVDTNLYRASASLLKTDDDLRINKHLSVGGKDDPLSNAIAVLREDAEETGLIVDVGALSTTGGSMIGIAGRAQDNQGGSGDVFGLNYLPVHTNSNAITNLIGCDVTPTAGDVGGSTGTVTNVVGYRTSFGNFFTGATVTNIMGLLYINNLLVPTNEYGVKIPALLAGTNRYAFHAEDITGGTIARMIDVSAMQIRGSGEYTDAANETPMFLNEGTTPTLRQVKWKAGDVLGSGDKVMVLV